ncbi:DUF2200 domain-containing protein [Lactiplantibacillus garii]|uniref:DUF2200 domain-containing protein n=1 Tax=Lactiplantibacillus garii TaxID=2306423 RepID=A0A3R8J7A6_9LACO|nr:DUF2200 domain-containing protein [Lactiplantibacillus garii]RRK10208.1 DUF2200 domain-containing protein [Lactiplantibacillus garii]
MTKIFTMSFKTIYGAYVNKLTRKNRTEAELRQVITWLSGYSDADLQTQLAHDVSVATFFGQLPQLNPNASKITGVVCGVRVENVQDPLMQRIRYLDKLVDELAKGRPLTKVLRS